MFVIECLAREIILRHLQNACFYTSVTDTAHLNTTTLINVHQYLCKVCCEIISHLTGYASYSICALPGLINLTATFDFELSCFS